MPEAEDKTLGPDQHLLHEIFPGSQSTPMSTLAQTYDTCTFVAHQCGSAGDDIVVQLETVGEDSTRFRTVVAMQSTAYLALPELAPIPDHHGSASTRDGRAIEPSVTKLVPHTVTLEAAASSEEVVNLTLSDARVRKGLEATGFTIGNSELKVTVMGGPNVGYFADMHGFLQSIVNSHAGGKRTSYFSADEASGSIIIHSKYDDIAPATITHDDFHSLQDSVVLCHHDLEPRNILVCPQKLVDGGSPTQQYHIAAIIDREMGGFFPLSYEYVYKNLLLSNFNLYYTWYALFKALSALLTRGWIKREGVVRLQPAEKGWSKQGDAPRSKQMAPIEMNDLVHEVLKELGRI